MSAGSTLEDIMNERSRFVFHAFVVAVILTLIVVVSPGTGASASGSDPTVVVPYGAAGYKYQVVPTDEGVGFERPDFDDSAFAVGDAGFGTREGYCPLNNPDAVKTDWPVGTDLLVRRTLDLPAGTTDVVVYVAVDNDAQVFVNGYDVSGGLQTHEDCPSVEFAFAVPDGVLRAGTNLLAVRARDRGILAFLDLSVTRQSRLRLGR
jgi:hypothetical protein